MQEAIQPYTRFIRTEREKLTGIASDLTKHRTGDAHACEREDRGVMS
jgi:hypothetical protein